MKSASIRLQITYIISRSCLVLLSLTINSLLALANCYKCIFTSIYMIMKHILCYLIKLYKAYSIVNETARLG